MRTGLLLCRDAREGSRLRRCMEESALLVDHCLETETAEKLMRSQSYDVVLCDGEVPGVRGLLEGFPSYLGAVRTVRAVMPPSESAADKSWKRWADFVLPREARTEHLRPLLSDDADHVPTQS